jgi:hypothetical protein
MNNLNKISLRTQGALTCILISCTLSTFAQDQLKMNNMIISDFTTTIVVNQSSKEAFDAICNVRGWWSEEIEGNASKLGDEFKYHYEDIHRCQIKLIEVIPKRKVVWLVMDNYFKFTSDKTEWTGTKIIFEISSKDNNTYIRFTHSGLVPAYECYAICSDGWHNYIDKSLYSLIATGKGQPNSTGTPRTVHERKLTTETGH